MTPALFPNQQVIWRLSAKWASKEVDCTARAIPEKCGGKCCRTPGFWPPSASGTGVCANLTASGCALGPGRPVTCLLYPFRVPPPEGGTLVLHGHALVSCCKPAYKSGGQMLIENMRSQFEILFGNDATDLMITNTREGRDSFIAVPGWVLESLAHEAKWEKANANPPDRSKLHEAPPAGNPLKILST